MNATTCGHRHQIQNHQTKHHRRHHHNHMCVLERVYICVCAVQLEASKRNRHCADNTSLLSGRVSFSPMDDRRV